MSKYKIEIEIDVDFDEIFSRIPGGLFSEEDKGCDEGYEKECIADVIKDAHLAALERSMKNMTSKHAAHHKHHDECSCAVAKQLFKNCKIKKIE